MQTAVEEYLTTRGAKVSAGKSASGHGNPYTDPEDVPGDTECVITLGGDGTLIQAARDLAGRDLPMIGINLGGLGLSHSDRAGRRCEGASGCAFGGFLPDPGAHDVKGLRLPGRKTCEGEYRVK